MNYSNNQISDMREKALANFAYFSILLADPGFYDINLHGRVDMFLQFCKSNHKGLVLPRSFLKTSEILKYGLWRGTKNPDIRILYTTNSDKNAQKKLQYIMGIVERNKIYQTLFPEVIPNFNKVRWSSDGAELNRSQSYPEATFECAGTRTSVISRHYNLILNDDTVSPDKDDISGSEIMPSRDMIEQAIAWHKLSTPLLVNPTDEIIVCGTRWCHYDLINFIQKNEPTYKWLDIPAFDEQGKPTYSRYNETALAAIKDTMGTYMFNALYLNKPLTSEHCVFLPEWIKHTMDVFEIGDGRVKVTVDPAISEKKKADFSVVLSARHWPGKIVVETYKRIKSSKPSELIDEVFHQLKLFQSHEVRVETIAYQAALVSLIKEEAIKREYPVTVSEYASRQKKEARIYNLAPLLEAGRLLLREGMELLETQLLQYPYGAHDDILDALSMQLPDYRPDYTEPPKKLETTNMKFSVTLDEILASLDARNKRNNNGYEWV